MLSFEQFLKPSSEKIFLISVTENVFVSFFPVISLLILPKSFSLFTTDAKQQAISVYMRKDFIFVECDRLSYSWSCHKSYCIDFTFKTLDQDGSLVFYDWCYAHYKQPIKCPLSLTACMYGLRFVWRTAGHCKIPSGHSLGVEGGGGGLGDYSSQYWKRLESLE